MRELTKGSITKGLIYFMLPILAGSLIQQLYNTVDIILVGKFVGDHATASIGASSLIVTCMIGFFNGMMVGTNVIAAQIFGSGNREKLKKTVQTVFAFGILGGLALMVIGLLLTPTFLRWMNTPDVIFEQAVSYLRIYLLSIVSIVLYNLTSGISRAVGDSSTPMVVQLIGGFINVVVDIFLIVGLNMGVVGAAVATFFSQTVAALILVHQIQTKLVGGNFFACFKAFDSNLLSQIMKIGIPSGVQAMIMTFSNIIIQTQINSFPVDAITAFTAFFKIEMVMYLPVIAMGQAVVSFVGQNYGAKQLDRAKKGVRTGMITGCLLLIGLSTFMMIFIRPAFGIFSESASVIDYGVQITSIMFPLYFIDMILECLSAEIRGFGQAFWPMVCTVFSFVVVRLASLFILLSIHREVRMISMVYPISWTSAILLLLIYRSIFMKKNKIYENK
ncbi:Na+ driven multidrug efflux pump [Lachnospiraceae bacterium TWA4]|nr:Na+ driven multidrug efflux pump [Lachnospiraceae bacterium TWA4]